MITSVLGQVKAATKIVLYLLGSFLVIRLWQDPAGSGHSVFTFINSIGSFFSSAVDKLSQFARGLGGSG
jgi:Ca2+-binding RTX toxin-like protein